MHRRFCCFILLAISAAAADKPGARELIALAHKKSTHLADSLRESLGDAEIKKGTAVAGEGADFIWAIESDARPILYVDDQAAAAMSRAANSNIWFSTGMLRTGTVHGFYYMVKGARTGGKYDVAAYGPESYPKAGVREGTLSEKTGSHQPNL
jgi:enterochelin esterase family protein